MTILTLIGFVILKILTAVFGYVNHKHVRLESTYYALKIIKDYNIELIDIDVHKKWLMNCYRDNGSFTEFPSNKPTIENILFCIGFVAFD